eukprot:TRINITY_DN4892_c0_g1_i2.p1 TRINITY_DN4892_c0_g1~~TRINITY_DN4892_c0_g1_i2.p1  ORF type:complete len:311 (+),score=56.11 TRINITY_DN4892_c0_g1_i2:536-1468(+)
MRRPPSASRVYDVADKEKVQAKKAPWKGAEKADTESLLEEIQQLKKLRNQDQEIIKNLKIELRKLESGGGAMTTPSKDINEAHGMRSSKGSMKSSITSIPSQSTNFSGSIFSSTDKNTRVSIEDVVEANNQLKTKINEMEKNYKIKLGKLQQINTMLLKAAKQGNPKLAKRINESESKIDEVAKKREVKKSENIYDVYRHIFSLEFKNKQKKDECDKLKETIKSLENEIKNLRERVENEQVKKDEINAQLAELRQEIDDHADDLKGNLEAEIHNLKAKIEDLTNERNKLLDLIDQTYSEMNINQELSWTL